MDVTNGTIYLLTEEGETIVRATDKREAIIDEATDYFKNNEGKPIVHKVTINDEEWDASPLRWKDEALQKLLAELAERS